MRYFYTPFIFVHAEVRQVRIIFSKFRVSCGHSPTARSATNKYLPQFLGQRYSVARTNNEATKGKDGVELVEAKPWTDPETGITGYYTRKIYHLDGYLPGWVRAIIPGSATKLYEESWDAFPKSKVRAFYQGSFSTSFFFRLVTALFARKGAEMIPGLVIEI